MVPKATLIQFPFYAKLVLSVLGLFLFFQILYIAQGIIIPIVYSTVLAIMLNPIVNLFLKLKIKRALAILLTLIPTLAAITGLTIFLISQGTAFKQSMPVLIQKLHQILQNGMIWVNSHYNVSLKEINTYLNQTRVEIVNNSSTVIGHTISTMGSILVVMILVPVYIFMILYYQPLLMEFIRRLFGSKYRSDINEVTIETKVIIHSYLTGLMLQAAIVATLYSVGLSILGIPYAILLGIIAAILNVIPYLGAAIAVTMFALFALVTKSSPSYVLYVILLYVVIHTLDNSYIIPKVVASKVKLNALTSITVVLAGEALWGIPGMFIAIPLTAIAKTIFDHIEPLQPWGFLIGDNMPDDNSKEH